MADMDLTGIVRATFEDRMSVDFSSGSAQMKSVMAMQIERLDQSGKRDRWVKQGGPIIATGDNFAPTRAELAEALGRIFAVNDAEDEAAEAQAV